MPPPPSSGIDADVAISPTIYMIGNAHIDPVWLWRWPEGCAEAIGTCWAAIDLLEEQPGVIFTRGEAAIYRWIEELEPALFARIKHFVRSGRWVIVNGWWIQPDCNLPDGEAFIRQALYGKAYVRDRFGIDVHTGYNVDSFGHAGTLPMLLRHSGYENYVFMRPQKHEKQLPGALFTWVAPDGSSVTTFRLQEAYTISTERIPERIARDEAQARDEGYPFMCFYGVGNHGGGPTREDLAAIRAVQEDGHVLVFSDPATYFNMIHALPDTTLAAVQDELQFHAIGCYAAVSALKALNRRAKSMLACAEAAAALAMRHADMSYPRPRLGDLWRTLLFNQFHDILCGTSLASATQDAIQALGGVIQGAEDILNTSLRRLASTVEAGAEPTDATFLVFNLSGTTQRMLVEYEPWLDWKVRAARRLLDHTDDELAYQELPSEACANGLRRILFTADVPPFGYQLYRFALGQPAASQSSSSTGPTSTGVATPFLTVQASPHTIESIAWRLEIDSETGSIARLVDRRAERDVCTGPAHLPIIVDDPTDTWSHGIDRFGFEGRTFACERIDIVERGPLRAGLRVRTRAGDSTIISTYLLPADPALPLEIRVKIDWHGKNQLLRLRYPLALATPTFRYEVPYGSLQRPADGQERPGQRWVLATSTDGYGVALANDAKYSYAALNGSLYITALRSPVYAHHDPFTIQQGEEYPYTDQGEQSFNIRLIAGVRIDALAAHQLACDLNRPPTVTPHVSRGGRGPQRASLLSIQAQSSVPVWLKAAENSDDLILRVLELIGQPDEIILPGSSQPETLRPYGIATFHGSQDGHWRDSNGLEQ